MTPVIANAVLYCTNSIFLKMIHWVDGNITIVKMRSSEGFINDQSASAWENTLQLTKKPYAFCAVTNFIVSMFIE